MIGRATDDFLRAGLRILVQLWPLWLFWFAWTFAGDCWLSVLLTLPDRSTTAYAVAYRAWPIVALLRPILVMVAAIIAYRLHRATHLMPFAGIAGVVVATLL